MAETHHARPREGWPPAEASLLLVSGPGAAKKSAVERSNSFWVTSGLLRLPPVDGREGAVSPQGRGCGGKRLTPWKGWENREGEGPSTPHPPSRSEGVPP